MRFRQLVRFHWFSCTLNKICFCPVFNMTYLRCCGYFLCNFQSLYRKVRKWTSRRLSARIRTEFVVINYYDVFKIFLLIKQSLHHMKQVAFRWWQLGLIEKFGQSSCLLDRLQQILKHQNILVPLRLAIPVKREHYSPRKFKFSLLCCAFVDSRMLSNSLNLLNVFIPRSNGFEILQHFDYIVEYNFVVRIFDGKLCSKSFKISLRHSTWWLNAFNIHNSTMLNGVEWKC